MRCYPVFELALVSSIINDVQTIVSYHDLSFCEHTYALAVYLLRSPGTSETIDTLQCLRILERWQGKNIFSKLRCGEYGYPSSMAERCVCVDAQGTADARKNVCTDWAVRPWSITCMVVRDRIIGSSDIDKLDIFYSFFAQTLEIDG